MYVEPRPAQAPPCTDPPPAAHCAKCHCGLYADDAYVLIVPSQPERNRCWRCSTTLDRLDMPGGGRAFGETHYYRPDAAERHRATGERLGRAEDVTTFAKGKVPA